MQVLISEGRVSRKVNDDRIFQQFLGLQLHPVTVGNDGAI